MNNNENTDNDKIINKLVTSETIEYLSINEFSNSDNSRWWVSPD